MVLRENLSYEYDASIQISWEHQNNDVSLGVIFAA